MGAVVRLVRSQSDPKLKAFWASIAKWKSNDPRFEDSAIRIANNTLRQRPSDISTRENLAKKHLSYYYRVIIGPTYRADMWAALDLNPELSTSELARIAYGSFATAWRVKNEWRLIKQAA